MLKLIKPMNLFYVITKILYGNNVHNMPPLSQSQVCDKANFLKVPFNRD